MRSVRSLAFRANPDAREIELLRAMAIEVVRATERERKQHKLALEAATARPNAAPAEEA
jgi:hypothetical protein